MLLKRFTDFILQGRLQAIGTAFAFAFLPLLGTLSVLIAALVTLRKGPFEGTLVLIAALLPEIIGYFTYPLNDDSGFAYIAIGFIFLSNIFTWLLAVVLRRFGHWSVVLEIAAFLGVFMVCAIHFVYPDIQNWWQTELTNYFNKTTSMIGVLNQDSMTPEMKLKAAEVSKYHMTGILAAFVLLNALLQLVLARWWQAVIFNPGGLQKELHEIRLSTIFGMIFLLGILLSYVGNALVLDIMPVFYFIFCAAGLSLLHGWFAKKRNGWLWLMIIYLGVIWVFPLSVIIISMIALLDTGIDFRKRFN